MDHKKSGPGLLNVVAFVLFGIFLTLKLAAVGLVANWSWWLVFSPLLILAGIYVVTFIIILITALVSRNR